VGACEEKNMSEDGEHSPPRNYDDDDEHSMDSKKKKSTLGSSKKERPPDPETLVGHIIDDLIKTDLRVGYPPIIPQVDPERYVIAYLCREPPHCDGSKKIQTLTQVEEQQLMICIHSAVMVCFS